MSRTSPLRADMMDGASKPESRYAWLLVVVASALMGMGAGALISISTFLKPISADFGWLRGETSFAYRADRYSTRPVDQAGYTT